uniref:Threonine ammonia-lyase n=1 Tax=Angomonas desouzai TaxID=59800 RepID=U5KLG9_9TRYP|nr:threonine ammonia-lyase [Angomonas desouzai]
MSENKVDMKSAAEKLINKHESAFKKLGATDPWINVELARRRISRKLPPTPLLKGRVLPKSVCKAEIKDLYYKCDHIRVTGAYKERGGLNALMSLNKEEAARGVIAASAGNHAQALALHGSQLGIPVTVVMPLNAPIVKVENCKGFGASVVLSGRNFSEAKQQAEKLAKEKGYRYVNGYDDAEIIFGAGTCGLEIIDQLPDVDVIVVPTGGGGLIAGISLAVKRLNPNIKVIGVESEACTSVSTALEKQNPTLAPVSAGGTLADGLAVETVGARAFGFIKEYVDKVITVPESLIARSVLHMLEVEKMLVEGAGATGLAGILSGKLDDDIRGMKVVTVITGGNIDINLLGRVIDLGLKASGRLHTFDISILNSVGSLAEMTRILSTTGASVKTINQENPMIYDVFRLTVHMEVETIDEAHWHRVKSTMQKHGYELTEYEMISNPALKPVSKL